MLKALELHGFKSFADKTRFEFPPGITVIVGPNGSGKSNIVDAIKWVLGEQSAKSLRGKDMADVIFKGGGAGRKIMNTAEATIVIDNSDRRLPVDAPEVHVSRRVYRSGEGEYLINGQPCRLRDVKDMFRGTGVGTDAYSLIEQGKVDRLLQASPRDRRAIFEEAAGISRFKAKKLESQRRLERVDQNLQQLSYIVEEVESRLKSVRSQAGKARRYREYSDRLQQLRTHVGRTDWRRLTGRLEELDGLLEELKLESQCAAAESEAREAEALEVEVEVTSLGEKIREAESRFSRNREQIAGIESTIDHQRELVRELEQEQQRRSSQLASLTGKAGDLQSRLRVASNQLEEAETEHRDICARREELESERDRVSTSVETLRSDIETRRQAYLEKMRESAQLGNRVGSRQSELTALEAVVASCGERLELAQADVRDASAELAVLQGQRESQEREQREVTEELEKAENDLNESRRLVARRQEELAALQGRLSGVQHRIDVLEDLEAKLEGISGGVREVMQKARAGEAPFNEVIGLVADLIDADVEVAPLVDVALGPLAHHVVVSGGGLLKALDEGSIELSGRVGLIDLHRRPLARHVQRWDLSNKGGVIGRADRIVRCAPEHQAFITTLIGSVWLVDELSTALALRKNTPPELGFVTSEGERVDSNGTVLVGPRQTAGDLVSRRAELRSLRLEKQRLANQLTTFRAELVRLRDNIQQREVAVRKLGDRQKGLAELLADTRVKARALEERRQRQQQQQDLADAERRSALAQQETAEAELKEARQALDELNLQLVDEEAVIRETEQELEAAETSHQQLSHDTTLAQVESAKSEQRVDSLRAERLRFEEDQRERKRVLDEAHQLLGRCVERRGQSQLTILNATSQLAELYLRKEQLAQATTNEIERREQLVGSRGELQETVQTLRKQLRKLAERQHKVELDAGEIRHQRSTLAERLQDDYGIDVSELEKEVEEQEEQERSEIEEEISSLRRKINNLGAVNMEALNELDELDARFAALSSQYHDLTSAKDSLERIIQRINADSRRLFSETLEAIRVNFHGLYRKAFGGGKADIALEEGVDILEAGVDIIATPPGKPSFNNSLLSGGEKALTAVALLLAIFQFRPSPFCVLDEVDAPFDEANIGRFVDVLREFLGWTRFVIVTHSKKTMTAATTLYGVTMQESGVSKQVSVKFDDVSEDGHIRPEAVRESENSEASDKDEEAA